MRLSQGVEWAVHCTGLVAQMEGTPLRRETLARHYDLPVAYLAKHLQALTRAGILHAAPGPRGGYRLARPAGEITVLDVVEAIDGAARPFVCREIRQCGAGALDPKLCKRPCEVDVVMAKAHNAWRASLRSVTIADLLARVPAATRRRNVSMYAG